MTQPPLIWSVTASDSSGGAGSAADLRVAQAMGVDCAVITLAITAQNSAGVQALTLVDRPMLEAQWQSLRQDGWPAVIRLGWLPASVECLRWLVPKLQAFPGQVVWDPVLAASQGGVLQSCWQTPALREYLVALLQRCRVITPNRTEARLLTGLPVASTPADCAAALQALGAGTVLITGGDSPLDDDVLEDWCFSSLADGTDELPGPQLLPVFRFRHRRIARQVHGTGCHLAAALACALAQGQTLYDALTQAVTMARLAVRCASQRHSGYDNARAVPLEQARAEDWPLVLPASEYWPDKAFLPAEPLGLYGLVDNLAHLQQLLELGIDSLQWRVKQPGPEYQADTARAIGLCRAAGVPLYLNDDWQLALALGAYGVHLGQEDVLTADLPALQRAGIRLGISTHSDWEIARARGVQPSYIACGPVFPPLSKQLRYPPLGIAQLCRWVSGFQHQSLTCIGGITHQNVAQVLATGIGSVAVVTDLRADDGLSQRLATFRRVLPAIRQEALEMV